MCGRRRATRRERAPTRSPLSEAARDSATARRTLCCVPEHSKSTHRDARERRYRNSTIYSCAASAPPPHRTARLCLPASVPLQPIEHDLLEPRRAGRIAPRALPAPLEQLGVAHARAVEPVRRRVARADEDVQLVGRAGGGRRGVRGAEAGPGCGGTDGRGRAGGSGSAVEVGGRGRAASPELYGLKVEPATCCRMQESAESREAEQGGKNREEGDKNEKATHRTPPRTAAP